MQPQPTGYQDVAHFDPYGPIAQGWGTNPQTPGQPSSTQATSANPSSTYNGHLHPREYIRTHKAELEVWDSFAWKQVLNTFDTLKDAWASRKKEVEARMIEVQRDYGYTGQQEVARLREVMKTAESNSGMCISSFLFFFFKAPVLIIIFTCRFCSSLFVSDA